MKAFVWLAASLAAVAGAAALSAQTRPAPEATSIDLLLQEVRELRAELAQAGAASIRAQVLVGRIQLQEQRIHTINGQLADVRRRLAAGEAALTAPAGALKMLQDAMRGAPADATAQRDPDAPTFDPLAIVRNQIQLGEAEMQTLRQEEAALAQQLAAEQARWTGFNEQLDALERSLMPASRPRR